MFIHPITGDQAIPGLSLLSTVAKVYIHLLNPRAGLPADEDHTPKRLMSILKHYTTAQEDFQPQNHLFHMNIGMLCSMSRDHITKTISHCMIMHGTATTKEDRKPDSRTPNKNRTPDSPQPKKT